MRRGLGVFRRPSSPSIGIRKGEWKEAYDAETFNRPYSVGNYQFKNAGEISI
jgi:hypothetical protein